MVPDDDEADGGVRWTDKLAQLLADPAAGRLTGLVVASWLTSLEYALRWRPEELYLYPLYVRPLTGLGRRVPVTAAGEAEHDLRPALYAAVLDRLLGAGYTQVWT